MEVSVSKIPGEMEKEDSPSDVRKENNNNSTNSSPHLSRSSFLSQSEDKFDTIDFSSFYPSTFLPNSNSLSMTPSECSDDDVGNATATESRLYEASVILEYQQLYNRYAMCLAYLQELIKEVDSLREQNDNLRLANADLVKRLSILSQATIQNCLLPTGGHRSPLSFMNDMDRLNIGGIVRGGNVHHDISHISPTSVIQHNPTERRNVERGTLPKSISVRSSGYLKMNQRGGSGVTSGGPSRSTSRHRVTSASPNRSSRRVYVPGGKREEEALEFEVYNQGMFKTELCNKWQETGSCPYGENCQFAHGITELRPVIRHPRYKTEVCRMVLAGDTCPYGHRCHFRHSLTDQEKLLGPR